MTAGSRGGQRSRRSLDTGSGARARGGVGGSGARQGGARGSGARRRSSSSATRRAPGPAGGGGLRIALIAVPAVCILGLVVWQLFSGGSEPVNENEQIEHLQSQIGNLEREYREVSALIGNEAENRSERASALQAKVDKWLEDWGAIFDPKRDQNGDLPTELAGWDQVPAPVQRLRNDLMRIMDF